MLTLVLPKPRWTAGQSPPGAGKIGAIGVVDTIVVGAKINLDRKRQKYSQPSITR
jgi:hypothetical protein